MRDILDPQDRWLGAPVGFVSSSNKAPVAIDDTLSVAIDSGPVTLDVLANDYDPEGQPLTLLGATAALGTATAEPDNTVSYTPPAGISGFDTIIYEVADDLDQRSIAQVDVTITGPSLALTTLADNTIVIEADTAALDLTITQPSDFAGMFSANIADLDSGPLNLVPPSVTGTFEAGQVLTAKPGLWIYDTVEGPPTRSWQWRAGGTDISGATGETYTVQSGDLGQVLSVAERQSDGAGAREATATVAGSQNFSPDLDAGLLGWWDASDTATLTDTAGAVSAWADKAGSGALEQSNPSLQPTTGSRLLNGLNVVDFDGFRYMQDLTRSLPASGNMAFHIALELDAVTNAYEAIFSVDAANDFQLDAFSDTQFDGQLNVTGIGSSTLLSGGPFSGGLIFSVIFDQTNPATAEVFVSGTSRAVMTYTTPLDTNVALNLMANRALNARLDGAIAEFAVTSTLGNRAEYHAYLASKWGLS